MLRRLKADVLHQLPPKRRQRVLVELPSAARRALDILARDSAQARQAAAAGGVDSGFEQQRLLSPVLWLLHLSPSISLPWCPLLSHPAACSLFLSLLVVLCIAPL